MAQCNPGQMSSHCATERRFAPTRRLHAGYGVLLLLAVIPDPALGQQVTLADLGGVVIEARLLRQQTLFREGREVSNQFQNDLKIEIGLSDRIQQMNSPTAYTARGIRKGKTTSGSWTIERSRETVTRGGGHSMWIFADGTLTFLRTFKGGALKRVFAFARSSNRLNCTASRTFVHEQGVRGIHLDSGIDDVPTVIQGRNHAMIRNLATRWQC
jgi:hypothetical protein